MTAPPPPLVILSANTIRGGDCIRLLVGIPTSLSIRPWVRFISGIVGDVPVIPMGEQIMAGHTRFKAAWLLLALATLAAPSAEAQERDHISPAIEERLAWLPADTETLLVAKSFLLPDEPRRPTSMSEVIPVALLHTGLYPGQAGSELLAGNKIEWALFGGRDFRTSGNIGVPPFAGCTILKFEQQLPDARRKWEQLASDKADEVRDLIGRKVYFFSNSTVANRRAMPKSWQRDLYTWLADDMLLFASSEVYLREVLERIDRKTPRSALPANLPEWKHVDASAPAWMLRHIPKPPGDLLGIAWRLTGEQVVVTYLTKKGQAGAAPLRVIGSWPMRGLEVTCETEAPNDETAITRCEVSKTCDPDIVNFVLFRICSGVESTEGQSDFPVNLPER